MKLHFYRKHRNFGDAINPWYWKHYLNIPLEEKSDDLLVGIGTLINDELPKNYRSIHIMGSGAGYGTSIPKIRENWIVHCVRGPLTARAIGASMVRAITDPAVLLHELISPRGDRDNSCTFMPHIGIDSPRLQNLVEQCGMIYISPQSDPMDVISAVNRSERLITSAMHGAILADALRVPWYPITHFPGLLHFKWHDWFESMEIRAQLQQLPTIWPQTRSDLMGRIIGSAKESWFRRGIIRIKTKGNFVLSSTPLLKEKCCRLKHIFHEFNENQRFETTERRISG